MKLVDKYLLKEHLITLVYCIAAFTMMFVVSDLFAHFSRFIEFKTPLLLAVKYYLCFFISIMEYLLPASLMLATIYTLWQMTRNNELTAMQASGINLYRIVLPILVVGLVFTLISAVVKETISPRTTMWAEDFDNNKFQKVNEKICHNQAYYNVKTHRLWLIEEFDLYNPRRFINVKVTEEREDGTRLREFFAGKAEWLDKQWWFYDPEVQEYDVYDHPVGRQKHMQEGSNIVKEMEFLTETPFEFVDEVKIQNPEFLSALEMINYIKTHENLSKAVVTEKKVDIHLRFAMPWACLIVCLFGIPAGAAGGTRRAAFTGVFTAIILLFGFYAFIQVGVFLAKRQVIAPWLGAWLSNIVFLITGIVMLKKMRH